MGAICLGMEATAMPDNECPNSGVHSDISLVRLPTLMIVVSLLAVSFGVAEYLYAERALGIFQLVQRNFALLLSLCLIALVFLLVHTQTPEMLAVRWLATILAICLIKVLINLVSHALKFTPQGYVDIAVKYEQCTNTMMHMEMNAICHFLPSLYECD